MKLHQGKSRLGGKKKLFSEKKVGLEQAAQGSGHSTKPVRVEGVS